MSSRQTWVPPSYLGAFVKVKSSADVLIRQYRCSVRFDVTPSSHLPSSAWEALGTLQSGQASEPRKCVACGSGGLWASPLAWEERWYDDPSNSSQVTPSTSTLPSSSTLVLHRDVWADLAFIPTILKPGKRSRSAQTTTSSQTTTDDECDSGLTMWIR